MLLSDTYGARIFAEFVVKKMSHGVKAPFLLSLLELTDCDGTIS